MINITPLDFSYTLLLCLGLWNDHTMPSSATLLSPSPLPFESPVCRHVLWSVPYHSRTLKGLQLFSTTFHVCSEICVANTLHLEKAMAPHSSTHAWKIPWMKEPGGLQSMGSLRVGHDWATSLSLFTVMHWRRKWQPTPVFLPGESQGWGSLVGCCLWGHTESDTTEATQQQQQHTPSCPHLLPQVWSYHFSRSLMWFHTRAQWSSNSYLGPLKYQHAPTIRQKDNSEQGVTNCLEMVREVFRGGRIWVI